MLLLITNIPYEIVLVQYEYRTYIFVILYRYMMMMDESIIIHQEVRKYGRTVRVLYRYTYRYIYEYSTLRSHT